MYDHHLKIGREAVSEAMRMTRTIQVELTKADSITKSDKSPVTIADFTAQAIVCEMLNQRFPEIPIVAEERSDALKEPENREVLEKIFYYIERGDAIGQRLNRVNLFRCIDLGGAPADSGMFWTLDPVDGTKGFLRGEQYAIALALINNGEVILGILGCPNLNLCHNSNHGTLLSAIKGQGTHVVDAANGATVDCSASSETDPVKMRFVESYVSAHSNMDMQLAIARSLKMERDPVRMDSQVKYAVVATGEAEIYLRIPNPKTPDYREKIWDHAAGSLVVQEAGGVVTDICGSPLDFSMGKTLKNNRGIFASVPSVRDRVLDIIKELSCR